MIITPIPGPPTHRLAHLQIWIVEHGSKIRDHATGTQAVVDDHFSLIAGNEVYCTQNTFTRLVERFPSLRPQWPFGG